MYCDMNEMRMNGRMDKSRFSGGNRHAFVCTVPSFEFSSGLNGGNGHLKAHQFVKRVGSVVQHIGESIGHVFNDAVDIERHSGLAYARLVIAKATDAVLDSRHVRLTRIKGDGRCLFRALARGLAANEDRKLTESMERQDADFLRGCAYKVICVQRRDEFRSNMVIEGNIDSYCHAMKSPSFYGGEAEMLVLSELLQKPIGVFLQAQPGKFQKIIEYGEQFRNKNEKPIRVLYNGHNHYDVLLPR